MGKFLSIIIPLYNSDERLRDALKSIQSQSFTDYEVVFVDDCSTDTTYRDIIKDFNFEYKLIVNEKNVKQGLARQIGLDASEGEWVTFLDHDDEFNPDCFQYVCNCIKEHATDKTLVLESNILVADDKSWMFNQMYRLSKNPVLLHGRFYNKSRLKYYNIRFHEDLSAHEDTFFSSLVENHILLDKTVEKDEAKLSTDLITYYWYLWEDSTSHEFVNNISYSEKNFEQHLKANYYAIQEIYSRYDDEKFMMYRVASLLLYTYWYIEGFKANNPDGYIKENINHVKKFLYDIVDNNRYGFTYESIYSFILSNAELYNFTYQQAMNNALCFFIPQITMKEYLESLK